MMIIEDLFGPTQRSPSVRIEGFSRSIPHAFLKTPTESEVGLANQRWQHGEYRKAMTDSSLAFP